MILSSSGTGNTLPHISKEIRVENFSKKLKTLRGMLVRFKTDIFVHLDQAATLPTEEKTKSIYLSQTLFEQYGTKKVSLKNSRWMDTKI